MKILDTIGEMEGPIISDLVHFTNIFTNILDYLHS